MISAGDFRNGITLEIDGNVYQIMEFQHVKPGKGAAFVRTKIKDVINGGVVERTFRPTEKFPAARIDRVDMQYLYADGDLYNFMDVNTYEQVALNTDLIGDALKFVKENEMCKICSYNGKVFSVEPPLFVELEITDTEPGFKGDTATVLPSQLLLRQVQLYMYLCSLTRAIRSRSIHVQASICPVYNFERIFA